MSKKSLREAQMDSAGLVDQAAEWSNALVQREARGPGDLPNAMERIERRYGVPYSAMWALRYRRPKDILASVYFRLHAAYQAECERQRKVLEHELAITEALAGSDHPAVVAAKALVDARDLSETGVSE